MSVLDSRLNKLMTSLRPKEHALLLLRNFKEGKHTERRFIAGLNADDICEYKRLVRLMSACNRELVALILLVDQLIDKLDVRLAWLTALSLWNEHVEALEAFITDYTKEQVTESEYAALKGQAEDLFVPVAELAELLVQEIEDWADDELEDRDAGVVKPECWERRQHLKERELASLVAKGVLEGKGRGKTLVIRQGSFYAWLGEDLKPCPEWASGYEVLPDSEAASASWHRHKREEARNWLRVGRDADSDSDPAELWRRMAENLQEMIRHDLVGHWGELGALEHVLDEIAGEFDGEDVLRPILRRDIDAAREKALNIKRQVESWVGPFDLPEADAQAIDETRALIQRWAS